MARSLKALSVGLLLVACGRDGPPLPSAASASASSAPVQPPVALSVAPRWPIRGEVAFDLTVTPKGALLAWAKPTAEGIAIHAALLDASGNQRGEPSEIARLEKRSSVAEITATTAAGITAIAWVERAGSAGTLRTVLGDPALGTFGKPTELGATTLADASRRGSIALAGDSDRLMAFHRGEAEPCVGDPKRECTRIGFSELSGRTPRPARIPLSVPAPCASAIAGFVVRANRWHYAVCSVDKGRQQTTAFRIQYEPRYAEAHEVLGGCTPAGAIATPNDVIVAGDCSDGRRAARVGTMNAPPITLDLSKLETTCELGRPRLSAATTPAFELRLDAPTDGLAALLPASIAPAGSRAVWTGAALLVARFSAGQVVVQRWSCRGAELVRVAS